MFTSNPLLVAAGRCAKPSGRPHGKVLVHADAELKLLDRPIVRRPEPPKPAEPAAKPTLPKQNVQPGNDRQQSRQQGPSGRSQGTNASQSNSQRNKNWKNRKRQGDNSRRGTAQANGAVKPPPAAADLKATDLPIEEQRPGKELAQEKEGAIEQPGATAHPETEPVARDRETTSAKTEPAAGAQLEAPPKIQPSLAGLQGPKRQPRPEPAKLSVSRPARPAAPSRAPQNSGPQPLQAKRLDAVPLQSAADGPEVAGEAKGQAQDELKDGEEQVSEEEQPSQSEPLPASLESPASAEQAKPTESKDSTSAKSSVLGELQQSAKPTPRAEPAAAVPELSAPQPPKAATAAASPRPLNRADPENSNAQLQTAATKDLSTDADVSKETEAVASGRPQPFLAPPTEPETSQLPEPPAPEIRGRPQRKSLTRSSTLEMYQRDPRQRSFRDQSPPAASQLGSRPATPQQERVTPDRGPGTAGQERFRADAGSAAAIQEQYRPDRRPVAAEQEDAAELLSDPDFSEAEGAATDSDEAPLLAAKPIMRRPDSNKSQEKPWKSDNVRAFRRMPSEMRVKEFERAPKAEKDQYSAAWRERASAKQTSAVPNADKQAAPGRPRDSGSRRAAKEHEKQDIEKQRASRQERRQQRQEQLKATAREQEEIFEVGSEGMSVGELADRLAVNGGDVLKALFMKGIMAQVNQVLDKDMVKMVAEEYGVEVLDLEEAGLDSMARKTADYEDEADLDFLVPRPPVVTVMGHVDHGKTSLLDYIRKTRVAAGEAGGITQAIGAYTVDVGGNEGASKQITFLDTPGHEAFSAMRARGTKVTDIAIIVVACDDGVRPQTKEAISHAKAAKVPIVVALNKIDKEGANLERAKQEMNEAGLLPEEWGGDTPFVPISAKKGAGIDELLETVLLVAEVGELTANPTRQACGSVVEAHLDRRMGPVATLLVATGTLRLGDVIHAGACFGKVRSMTDSRAESLEEAGPSIAVQMVGLNGIPVAGDEFAAVTSEQEARKMASAIEASQRISRLAEQAGGSMVTSMTLATMDEDNDALQHLNLVLKADASGSVEAIKAALMALPQDRVSLRFLMAVAGEVTASDVQLAYASEGQVISFNLEPSEAVQALAKQYGVLIKQYKVIYDLINDVRDLMEGRLGAVEERTPIGEAEVRAVFGSGSKKVAGCAVTEGVLRKGSLVVVTRGKRQVHEGKLESLRRVKEDVTEISNGNECGVGVAGFMEWREGDKLEAFEVVSKKQTLEEASSARAAAAASLDEWDEEEE